VCWGGSTILCEVKVPIANKKSETVWWDGNGLWGED
jgi:hypothetical protein